MSCFVLLGINRGLEEREENVLQHLGVVWYDVLCLENVTARQTKN